MLVFWSLLPHKWSIWSNNNLDNCLKNTNMTLKKQYLSEALQFLQFRTLNQKLENSRLKDFLTLWTKSSQSLKDPSINPSWCRSKVHTILPVEVLLLQVLSNKERSKLGTRFNSTDTDASLNLKLSAFRHSTRLWTTERLVIISVF